MRYIKTLVAAASLLTATASNAAGPSKDGIGNFGPTGIEVEAHPKGVLTITGVQEGSPSAGLFDEGQVITAINGEVLAGDIDSLRVQLGGFITKAEATDGVLKFALKPTKEVRLTIPVLGSYAKTWPVNCPKSEKIIKANAAYLRKLAAAGKLGEHKLEDALGILSLLSTGEEDDLAIVSSIYRQRMSGFKSGSIVNHAWNNGYQGIAACEYYLRTGDKSVMPLIDAICESARKWEVHGSWTHWAEAVTKYGVVNACGTNVLTTLLLAKQCGAKVDDETMRRSLRFFYRFAGHGANPYGHHRPEDGYGSNNGRTELLALAMQAASMAGDGEAYGMARDKCASYALYDYADLLHGHTGPMGAMWYAPVAATLIDKQPALYQNRMAQTQWFFELSRRHDGSFGMSGTQRYDDLDYGRIMMLGFTAPKKHLQILGAAPSKNAVPFTLPELPWGREADLAFFKLEGGPAYQPSGLPPHLELASIAKAGKEQLRSFASHSEHVFREETADAIRSNKHYDLIEELLESPDPFARHTASMAINFFQPWKISASKGWISAKAIPKEAVTPRMFDSLIKMVRNPDEALWLVDQSLIALALAKPEQTMSQLDALLPWLENEEWWFEESTAMALSPALADAKGARRIIPALCKTISSNTANKSRNYIQWSLVRSSGEIPEEARHLIPEYLVKTYATTPSETSVAGEMDRTGISSQHLYNTLNWVLNVDPELAPEMAKLCASRFDDLQDREWALSLENLVKAAGNLKPAQKREVGQLLAEHFRPKLIRENPGILDPGFSGNQAQRATALDLILQIDGLSGDPVGWKLLEKSAGGSQEWFYHSFDPAEKLSPRQANRYRKISFPKELQDWFKSDYDPASHGWEKAVVKTGTRAPDKFKDASGWQKNHLAKAGEVVLMRKTFEIDDPDQAMCRLVAFTNQGYRIYLNGHLIAENAYKSKRWNRRFSYSDKKNVIREHLKKGTNVIAAMTFLELAPRKDGGLEIYLEGMKDLPKQQN
jgi:hypothetical protein